MTHPFAPPSFTAGDCILIGRGFSLRRGRALQGSAATCHNAPELTGVMTESIIAKRLSGIPPSRCIHQHRKDDAYVKSISTFTRNFRGGPARTERHHLGGAVMNTEGVEFYRQFAGRLRSARSALQLSELQAALLAGVSPKTYRRWEAGKRVGSVKYLQAFCRRSGVSFAYLLGEEGGSFFSDNSVRH
jgi:DNA-binding XRE family transcriptional regulator